MRRMRSSLKRCWPIVAISTFLIYFHDVRVQAQICRGNWPAFNAPTDGYVGEDGRKHYRVYLHDDTVSGGHAADIFWALNASMTEWNNKAHLTNVILEWTDNEGIADLFVGEGDSPDSGLCAKYYPYHDDIIFSTGFTATTADNINDGAAIFSHEIGHFLGLEDIAINSGSSSVMQQADGEDCEEVARGLNSVQDADAWNALDCITQYTPPAPVYESYTEPEGPYPAPPPEPYYYWCWDYYLRTDYYSCVGNACQYQYSTWVWLYVSCAPF